MTLVHRQIVVGVSGGIAAYKSVVLVRELLARGAQVRVVMSRGAQHFLGPATFSGLLGEPPLLDLWDPSGGGEPHVELGSWAEAIVVAPATMNVLGGLAHGLADDALLATVACYRGPLLLAPAMHFRMWQQPSTQANAQLLQQRGATLVGPEEGLLASGELGEGRMAEPLTIALALERIFAVHDLAGLRIVITGGPTHEDLDPVRFLGNRSSGKMGIAIAERAATRGAEVVLVLGPTALPPPEGVETIRVRSAVEMRDAVFSVAEGADAIVMAAAVADYRPAERLEQKRKKTEGDLELRLTRNPDILAELGASRVGGRPTLVGFALETEGLIDYARDKLERKGIDLIVANLAEDALGLATNQVALVDGAGVDRLPSMSKEDVADRLLDRILRLHAS